MYKIICKNYLKFCASFDTPKNPQFESTANDFLASIRPLKKPSTLNRYATQLEYLLRKATGDGIKLCRQSRVRTAINQQIFSLDEKELDSILLEIKKKAKKTIQLSLSSLRQDVESEQQQIYNPVIYLTIIVFTYLILNHYTTQPKCIKS